VLLWRLGVERLAQQGCDLFSFPGRYRCERRGGSHRTYRCLATGRAGIRGPRFEEPLVTAAVFYARLQCWGQVPSGELLAETAPWVIDRLFFPRCKMEPAGGRDFAFANVRSPQPAAGR
jgi:hypothetical protein